MTIIVIGLAQLLVEVFLRKEVNIARIYLFTATVLIVIFITNITLKITVSLSESIKIPLVWIVLVRTIIAYSRHAIKIIIIRSPFWVVSCNIGTIIDKGARVIKTN
ncbi:MAG: hypothetical protein C4523_12725 [Myxococcales bacterium]|nr:MAG: hypothetical protein C4523_12725 [Myxococcales bacterium]